MGCMVVWNEGSTLRWNEDGTVAWVESCVVVWNGDRSWSSWSESDPCIRIGELLEVRRGGLSSHLVVVSSSRILRCMSERPEGPAFKHGVCGYRSTRWRMGTTMLPSAEVKGCQVHT